MSRKKNFTKEKEHTIKALQKIQDQQKQSGDNPVLLWVLNKSEGMLKDKLVNIAQMELGWEVNEA